MFDSVLGNAATPLIELSSRLALFASGASLLSAKAFKQSKNKLNAVFAESGVDRRSDLPIAEAEDISAQRDDYRQETSAALNRACEHVEPAPVQEVKPVVRDDVRRWLEQVETFNPAMLTLVQRSHLG